MSGGFDRGRVAAAVAELIAGFGEDPSREGLVGTPSRVARAWAELLDGYDLDPRALLTTSDGRDGFREVGGYDGVVVVAGIPFTSWCEHHLLPFHGTADVGYLPALEGPVVGVSKVPRLVLAYAHRLQVQERLTRQVADALATHLGPRGVGVRISATHLCMACRGVRTAAPMVTQVLLGAFRDDPATRAEFLSLADRAHRP